MQYFLGCPEWSRPEWRGHLFPAQARPADFLGEYAQVLSAVEGNTTFYALPRAEVVARWKEATPSNFRFCFKFPRSISHELRLEQAGAQTSEFLTRLAPLEERLGPFMLQLPSDFGRNRWPLLQQFLRQLPAEFDYAVEVRNLAYFDERETEFALDEFLQRHNVARVLFDTRELMACRHNDASTIEAQRKKPKVPVRFTATNQTPILRFVGHPDNEANYPVLRDWARRVAQWMREGRTPYIFLHTPAENVRAPQLARDFHDFLREEEPSLPPLPSFAGESGGSHEQLSLF